MVPRAGQADYADKRRPENRCSSVLCCRQSQKTPHNHPLSINGGFLNSTEAGAIGALVIALLRRSLGGGKLWSLLVETGQITVSVLFLVMAASFFSRMLALSGLPAAFGDALLSGPIGPWGFLVLYLAVVILVGGIIDSMCIMLIVLPIAVPVAQAAGFDMIWFRVMTVIAV